MASPPHTECAGPVWLRARCSSKVLAERAVERFVRAERAARHADDGRDAGAHANIHRACARAQRVRVQALVCGRGGAGLSRARSSSRCSGEVSALETQKSAVQCLWVAEPPINESSWLAQVAGIRSLALSRAAARWGGWAWPRWADAALRAAPALEDGQPRSRGREPAEMGAVERQKAPRGRSAGFVFS